jgi:hypothetical protein
MQTVKETDFKELFQLSHQAKKQITKQKNSNLPPKGGVSSQSCSII